MLPIRYLLLFGLFLVFATDAPAAKAKKKGGVTGTVVSVTPNKDDKDSGTITIKTVPGKKDDTKAGEEKTFKYTKDTKYWKAEGKKNEVAAVLADVVKDARVMISASGEPPVADKVTIMPGKK